MAVNLNENKYFKFVVISDKPKSSKNNFTEKPSKDKDNMSTKSSTPPNSNEKSLDEEKPNSQETNKQSVPEVKVTDTPKNNEDSTKEQKNDVKSRSVQNSLSIEVPSKGAPPQLVTSPSEIITGTKASESSIPPTSPSFKTSFKNVGKKLGNMIRNSSDKDTVSNTIPEQEEAVTSDSTVQTQEEQQIVNNEINTTPDSIPERSIPVAENNSTENEKIDENQKTPVTGAAKQRINSLSKFANVKLFITRTSSVLVEKLKEEFDELDKRIYPEMAEENEATSSRDVTIDEREQLLENKDISSVPNDSKLQKAQSTQSVLSDVGIALNERKEKLESLGEKTEELSNHSSNFLEMAAEIRRKQEQKNKSWFW